MSSSHCSKPLAALAWLNHVASRRRTSRCLDRAAPARTARRGCACLAGAGTAMRACGRPVLQARAGHRQPAAADPETKEWSAVPINVASDGEACITSSFVGASTPQIFACTAHVPGRRQPMPHARTDRQVTALLNMADRRSGSSICGGCGTAQPCRVRDGHFRVENTSHHMLQLGNHQLSEVLLFAGFLLVVACITR